MESLSRKIILDERNILLYPKLEIGETSEVFFEEDINIQQKAPIKIVKKLKHYKYNIVRLKEQ